MKTPTVNARLRDAFRFFHEHAGYCSPPGKAKCALDLARAEEAARKADVVFVWEDDTECDWSFVDTWPDADQKRWHRDEHYAESCRLVRPCHVSARFAHDTVNCDHAETLGALYGITDADSNYRRVIEAELAWEAFDTLNAERAA